MRHWTRGFALTDHTPKRGQERFVASVEETPLHEVDEVDTESAPTSLWGDAWKELRRNPMFVISAFLLVIIGIVVAVPGMFTSVDPGYCDLTRSLEPAQSGHPFGFDQQGCDVFSRTIYGARASVAVGVFTTMFVVLVGGSIGALTGFYGGWLDAIFSRLTDIFFAIPFVLGAIVILQVLENIADITGFVKGVGVVVIALTIFGWTTISRIMRGAVLSVRNAEFVDAATAVGATRRRNLVRHVVPNAMAPVIVYATVAFGIFIVAEATLSFLGLGLPYNVISWGNDIAQAQVLIRGGRSVGVLFYPAAALAITVLSFIMMGDAVRDALDPKARKR